MKNLLLLICILFGNYFTILAQDAAKPVQEVSTNQLAVLMVVIALVLAFVIWGMGQVLHTMGRQILEKMKLENNAKVLAITGMLFFCNSAFAQEKINAMQLTNNNYGGLTSLTFWLLAIVITVEFCVIAFFMFSISRLQKELVPDVTAKSFQLLAWWKKYDRKILTRAVSVEEEKDILLDHDYDGIKELNNALPPWWKYGFYFTIVVAFVYMLNFHVFGTGKNPTEEYQEEMVKAQSDLEQYNSKNADRVDENNIQMPGAEGLSAAKEIFNTVCWTCHGKMGEGGAGPNLTDNYWLHKGSLNDIYQSVKHGYPDKGMQAWEKNYNQKEINNLAGYIKTLHGTNPPNAKAPQGDLFEEIVTDKKDTNQVK